MIDTSTLTCGPLMRSNIDTLCSLIEERSSACKESGDTFRYLELGIMSAQTVCCAAQALSRFCKNDNWRVYGVDLDGGPWIKSGDCYQRDRIRSVLEGFKVNISTTLCHTEEPSGTIDIYLVGTEPFLRFMAKIGMLFDVVMIDACHEGPCCTRDFILAEPLVKSKGVICFHDSDPAIQGYDIQPHCKHPILVRSVLDCMGLLDGSRNGWSLIADLIHVPPNPDRGMAFFRRS